MYTYNVRNPNRNIRTDDKVFVDFRQSSQDGTKLGRPRTKLDHLIGSPYPMLGHFADSFEVEIYGIPKIISSDRVSPAPMEPAPRDIISGDKNAEQENPKRIRTVKKRRRKKRKKTELYFIDKIIEERADEGGKALFKIC